MPVDSRQTIQQAIKERKYVNKDFDAFRNDLEEYARTFFPNKIQDFSPNGFGGLLLELASYIGDVQSFYLDHQFGELNAETAVETKNLEKLLREAGVQIVGAAPAVVNATFYIKVPALNSSYDRTGLPVVKAGTTIASNSGITFQLIDDIDFTVTKSDGTPGIIVSNTNGSRASSINYVIGDLNNSGQPLNYIFSANGDCISSITSVESFTVNGFEPFKRYTLQSRDVTDIISVTDSDGNNYYEVDFLTQDTVFRSVKNKVSVGDTPVDQPYVDSNLEILPAPFRFYRTTSLSTRQTTLTFGGGSGQTMNDDLVPDPSQAALPLYGKKTFSRFTIDPNNLLKTSTLGSIAPNVTITVTYRSGGGLNHNIPPQSISEISTLIMNFPNNPTTAIAASVRASTDANNNDAAVGGADAPNIDALRLQIPSARNAQSRIVSKEDLLARIYSLPPNFGRVYRASIRSNPDNSNSALLYILCRNQNNQLVLAPDLLKKNLAVYLNQYRMISDAIDILDGRIIDLQINYDITVDPTYNRQLVLQNVQSKLIQYFNIGNFQMDQPLILDDIRNIIYNNVGVLAVRGLVVTNITGTVSGRTYSSVKYDINTNLINNSILIPPAGGMFEVRFLDQDIIGRAA
jgi:hypothetical protein